MPQKTSATLVARQVRRLVRKSRGGYRLHHANGRTIAVMPGRSILEAVRSAGIPHASVCGGRARCTTCRVRVGDGLDALPPPNKLESDALDRIEAAPNVRLACQTRPLQDLHIMPLLAVDTSASDNRPGGMQGQERRITALFVDLRGSTLLGEQKLPYDVLFILNRFFAELADALAITAGHYAQFNGDGLLALYGLKGKSADGCRAALAGAVLMQRNLERLNASLGSELAEPLRIGIGIHHGAAIVGSMGPPQAPIVSAIGDTINTAARLEALTKDYACTLVVSADTWRRANLEPGPFQQHDVQVRGKQTLLSVYAVNDLARLERLLNSGPAPASGGV